MCGIVGVAGFPVEYDSLLNGAYALHHRGPDDKGIYLDRDNSVGLAHARLAIIEPRNGRQPLTDQTEDLVLVCNGEIYDFERIRKDLVRRGHHFKSGSDSEVIIHLYRQYGRAFVEHLRGEFAFLLYDRRDKKLLAVRDRFGIKPLYYHHRQGRFLFGSEAKALFATGLLDAQIDAVAVRNYLSRVMQDSIFQDVHALPPGSMMCVDVTTGSYTIDQYWDIPAAGDDPIAPTANGLAESIELVRTTFDEALKLRLRADVPVGTYLSGGLDSAVVATTAAEHVSGPLKAFTISFPDQPNLDERSLATKVADRIGAEMYTVDVNNQLLLEHLDPCLWTSELPCLGLHVVGKYLLSQLASQHIKVALTGEGADELLLGYEFYKGGLPNRQSDKDRNLRPLRGIHIDRIRAELGFVPRMKFVDHFKPSRQRWLTTLFDRQHRRSLSAAHPLDSMKSGIHTGHIQDWLPVRQFQYLTFKRTLAPFCLSLLGDRPEMANSLEGRLSFLDHHFVEAVCRIPDEFKIHNGVEKYVLREAMKDRLPSEIYERTKFPYAAPAPIISRGLDGTVNALLDHYCSQEAIETAGIFNAQQVLRLLSPDRRLRWFESRAQQHLQRQMLFVLTTQMLESTYVQNFGVKMDEILGKISSQPLEPHVIIAGDRLRRAG